MSSTSSKAGVRVDDEARSCQRRRLLLAASSPLDNAVGLDQRRLLFAASPLVALLAPVGKRKSVEVEDIYSGRNLEPPGRHSKNCFVYISVLGFTARFVILGISYKTRYKLSQLENLPREEFYRFIGKLFSDKESIVYEDDESLDELLEYISSNTDHHALIETPEEEADLDDGTEREKKGRKDEQIDLIDDKAIKKSDYDWRFSTEELLYIKWRDNKPVRLVSNLYNPEDVETVSRKHKDGTRQDIASLQTISDYNCHMGYVAKSDMLDSRTKNFMKVLQHGKKAVVSM
ncbi:hypothetical protein ILUMI_13606 [Ignelater luminosus]|uniref:PiggyBac transposable element-derived protein domain-containing protein n=1 Tax=Ignelater luminosus TaxID=2038154 RepID=A0A8K0CS25_IGNLU|nr:hypothetical protein ILUMI_13606 [Ignelater luminosus]